MHQQNVVIKIERIVVLKRNVAKRTSCQTLKKNTKIH